MEYFWECVMKQEGSPLPSLVSISLPLVRTKLRGIEDGGHWS